MTTRAHMQSSGALPPAEDANPQAIPDLTTDEIRQARRKVQNRLNQRAYRSRTRERKSVGGTGQPYRVHRWRIDDGGDDMPEIKPRGNAKETKKNSAPSNQPALRDQPAPIAEPPSEDRALVSGSTAARVTSNGASSSWRRLTYCLLSDHLLHLIHFNVLRGLSYNKKVIQPGTFLECANSASVQLKRVLPHIPHASSRAPALRLPESLAPTSLQLSHPHSNWIDVFPFPKMRDNLIRWENYFNHAEFLTDLLGNMINCMTAPPPCVPKLRTLPGTRVQITQLGEDDDDDDDTMADRRGLILWGEPYQKDSWEMTPGFLRKWLWAVEGCGELIESTNRWRTVRGEMPLRIAELSQ